MDFGKDLSLRSGTLLDMAMKSCPLTMLSTETIAEIAPACWHDVDLAIEFLGFPDKSEYTWPQVVQILEVLRV